MRGFIRFLERRGLASSPALAVLRAPKLPHAVPKPLSVEDAAEIIEAPCVISTLPVWHVLKVVPEDELPDWYTGQIRYLAQDRFRIAWAFC